MNYKLVKSKEIDINRLIEYKKQTVYSYAHNLTDEEINKINNYIKNEVIELLEYYNNIIIDNKIIGCLLLTNKDDGKLLDEIYLEEEYRNKGIGTDIIKNIINNNDIVYLWVYKENIKAVSLYKRLGFNIIEETDTRYYMKYKK